MHTKHLLMCDFIFSTHLPVEANLRFYFSRIKGNFHSFAFFKDTIISQELKSSPLLFCGYNVFEVLEITEYQSNSIL